MKAHVVSSHPTLGTSIGTRKTTSSATGNHKTRSKPNQSILNFFAKSDRSGAASRNVVDDQELFFKDSTSGGSNVPDTDSSNTPAFIHESEHVLGGDGEETRYNEFSSSVKRRRVNSPEASLSEEDSCWRQTSEQPEEERGPYNLGVASNGPSQPLKIRGKSQSRRGPFIEESDTEGEQDTPTEMDDLYISSNKPKKSTQGQNVVSGTGTKVSRSTYRDYDQPTTEDVADNSTLRDFIQPPLDQCDGAVPSSAVRPSLIRESTSAMPLDEFEGVEDFEDEFFEEGEEYRERRYLEEQRIFEEGLDEDSKSESAEEGPITPKQPGQHKASPDEAGSCPICNESMKGTTEAEASAHVNGCLDGKSIPLPVKKKQSDQCNVEETPRAIVGAKRFQRATIARPGQQNPFSFSKDGSSSSAFSKLMSGHAEDAAWAAAAVNEISSRGRPAYQRTCPFYKIMPGLYICVDAFRYGKVEGQNAYFLSHFHSDHYIGLTSSWSHGPIYCSKVTANLVRQQLKVDPKWVVDLVFEQKVEIPGTHGVFVTMIPANHCPGSSLYLFEKVVGKGTHPKTNRILHCGDFRACPAHINHPLLRPDVVDSISGKTKQQMIDTCYLDTTYLTPKYAFPSQEDVITSCAEMCVSLSKEIPDTTDGWERAKLERAGSGMAKFLEKGSTEDSLVVITKEDAPLIKKEDDAIDVKPNKRGRLLVVIGTYSIGKERICLGIAKALDSKIYAPASKQRICAALEDAELSSRLTTNPLEAQVHMQMLMEIRAETLLEYLQGFKTHFSRVVGFRPTGWNYRPPTSRFTENPAVSTVLHSEGWKSRFTMKDLMPQRGSTRESSCFGVPYSEHSSFRELTMFCCALRIGRVIPTVNVGSAKSREKMKMWVEKWEAEKKKSGLFKVEEGATAW